LSREAGDVARGRDVSSELTKGRKEGELKST